MNDVRHAIADAVLDLLDTRLDFLPLDANDAATHVLYELNERRLVRTVVRAIDEDDNTMDEQVFDGDY